MVSHEEMSPQKRTREVEVVLPTGVREKIQVCRLCTVNELKVICEACFGIPTELQKLSHDDRKSELRDCAMVPKTPLRLEVPTWWSKFICCILKNEIENVYRRVQLPMQQVGNDERIFVALFIGACCGMEDLVARIIDLKSLITLSTATDTGRTLLHACALSGSLKCLEIIIKQLRTSSLDSLENIDVNKESAFDIAKRLCHHEVAELLLQLIETKLTQDDIHRNGEQSENVVPEAKATSNLPHQRQANWNYKINSEDVSNERLVEKNQQNEQSYVNGGINSNDTVNDENTLRGNLVLTKCEENTNLNEKIKFMLSEEAWKTSDISIPALGSTPVEDTSHCSNKVLSIPKRVSRHLLSRRRGSEKSIFNPHNEESDISTGIELELKTRLPSLGPRKALTVHPVDGEKVFQVQHGRGRQLALRSFSTPNSPDRSPVVSPRNSPTSEIAPALLDTKSAPNSPMLSRPSTNRTFRAVGMTAAFAVGACRNPRNSLVSRPKLSREPLALAAPNIGNAGVKFDRFRRGSLAVGTGDVKVSLQRGKSRSVCEVTLNESLGNHFLAKSMETEERLELPWNAWIAAKRREFPAQQSASTLTPTPQNKQLHVSVSPNSRRRSFQQWLNDKDMEQLQRMHEQSEIEEQKDAERTGRQVRGKSFEEWLEDKHRESQREKEKMREKEEAEKDEAEKKMRRRRMSQQKYQSWLHEKELQALEEEEKLLGEAKQKFEKMKAKWEEEDEMKKKFPMAVGKFPVGRTKSCPTSNSGEGEKISRQRFSSLQVTSK